MRMNFAAHDLAPVSPGQGLRDFGPGTVLDAIATPDHVAQAVMAFVENDMLTGQDVVVDGGKNILY